MKSDNSVSERQEKLVEKQFAIYEKAKEKRSNKNKKFFGEDNLQLQELYPRR